MTDTEKPRRIRSFVLRSGRATRSQKRALETAWPRYGLEREAGALEVEAAFGRRAPLVLEIGFGMGQSLAAMAAANPGVDYLGIEVHRPGVGSLLHAMEEERIENIRIYRDDAVPVLEECIGDGSLHGVQIFFPDPWHKKRHRKRRLIQAPFVALLSRKLRPGGFLHLATDWEDYAEQMLEVLSADPELINTAPDAGYCPRPEHRPLTRFEQRGLQLGHEVWDLAFERRKAE